MRQQPSDVRLPRSCPCVSRVRTQRFRRRCSTVVGSPPIRSPIRASDHPAAQGRGATSTCSVEPLLTRLTNALATPRPSPAAAEPPNRGLQGPGERPPNQPHANQSRREDRRVTRSGKEAGLVARTSDASRASRTGRGLVAERHRARRCPEQLLSPARRAEPAVADRTWRSWSLTDAATGLLGRSIAS